MEKLADNLTKYVIAKKKNAKTDYEILKYGFQVGIEVFVCIVVTMIIAIYMHMFIEFLLLLGIFFIVRAYGGGIHLNNFTSCFWCSSVVITGILLFVKNSSIQSSTTWGIMLFCMLCIFLMGPVESTNKPLDLDEEDHFSKSLAMGLFEILAISILLHILRKDTYVSIIAVTIFVIMISMIIGKIKNKILETHVN